MISQIHIHHYLERNFGGTYANGIQRRNWTNTDHRRRLVDTKCVVRRHRSASRALLRRSLGKWTLRSLARPGRRAARPPYAPHLKFLLLESTILDKSTAGNQLLNLRATDGRPSLIKAYVVNITTCEHHISEDHTCGDLVWWLSPQVVVNITTTCGDVHHNLW